MRLKLIIITSLLLITSCSSPDKKLYKAKPAFYSYIIGDVKSNKITKEHYSEVYATPASCQKVVTSLVAIKTLGPEYRYKTELLTRRKGKSAEDVIIKFSGDPALSLEQLTTLLKPLQNSKINGNLILDASAFNVPPYSPNIIIGDMGTWYSPPVSTINIDKNLIAVDVLPQKIGTAAKIHTNQNYKIISTVITDDNPSSIKLSLKENVIHATGNINYKDKPLELKISPIDHDTYVKNKIRSVLNDLNIKTKGTVKITYNKNQVPSNLKTINIVESDPLKALIPPALKNSNNLVFDSIYLTVINNNSTKIIADWTEGNVIIKDLVKKHFSIEMEDSLFVDGSGLSRYNRIKPKLLFSLLKNGFKTKEFVESLASAGEEDSTLQKRTTLPEYIRAKTGSMSGISCLCGYSLKSPTRPKAFVIMVNSFSPPFQDLYEVVDNFVKSEV